MYDDEYSYDRRNDDYDDGPPGRSRQRSPPPPEDYDDRDYDSGPPPRRGGPRGPERPPMPQKIKKPLGPNQVPGLISILVIIGIIIMFVGLTIMTFATPTNPPPEVPDTTDSDKLQEWNEDKDDWELKYGNSYRLKEQLTQVGILLHNIGALLAGLALVGGGLMLHTLDMKLRTTMITAGIILVVIMFMIPFAWSSLSQPDYGFSLF